MALKLRSEVLTWEGREVKAGVEFSLDLDFVRDLGVWRDDFISLSVSLTPD